MVRGKKDSRAPVKIVRQRCFCKCGNVFKRRDSTEVYCSQCKSTDVKVREVKVDGHVCARCEHEWERKPGGKFPDQPPRVCPKCKSPWWDVPRSTEAAK